MTRTSTVEPHPGRRTAPAAEAGTLVAALQTSDMRVTAPRRAVVQLVERQGTGHFTAADLVADARAGRIRVGRATVFRTLDLLLDAGLIERVDLPDGEHAYVACQASHHHHVICTGCGRTTDIADAELRTMFGVIARTTGYAIDGHRLELYGRCPACRRVVPT